VFSNRLFCPGLTALWLLSMPIAAAAAAPVEPAAGPPSVPKTLDLRLGPLRNFLAPREWFTPLPAELDEVLIRGRRQPGELPDRKALPQGLGGLFWGARNPTQAWRLLVPDPNVEVPPRSLDSPQDPPGASRTRIGEPGRIF